MNFFYFFMEESKAIMTKQKKLIMVPFFEKFLDSIFIILLLNFKNIVNFHYLIYFLNCFKNSK